MQKDTPVEARSDSSTPVRFSTRLRAYRPQFMRMWSNPTENKVTPSAHTPNRLELHVQRFIVWLFLLPFSGSLVLLMKYFAKFRIRNMREIRRQFREIAKHDEPLLICANHLTFIDSALIIWALASKPWYLFHFKKLSWNLPAGDFFKKNPVFRYTAYLTKCIFIHRDGSKEHQNAILDHCRWLLERKEVVTIFPEGRRSRSGRIDMDNLTYGVGKILAGMGRPCRVLCVYMRADGQDTYSNWPKKNSVFHFEMKAIMAGSQKEGREAYAEITGQIAGTLKDMENRYFKVDNERAAAELS